MDGMSNYVKEIALKVMSGWMEANPTQCPWVADACRLSTSVCDNDGAGWVECTGSGYSFVQQGINQFAFATYYGANDNPMLYQYPVDGYARLEFPEAISDWPAVYQFGRWGHETQTNSVYFRYGFELGTGSGIVVPAGAKLVFQADVAGAGFNTQFTTP